jgi:hypothetical protein
MNLKKILGLILCLLFIRSLSSSLQPQQIVRDARMSKKELIKIWKEWMEKFPMPEDAIELEVEKSFPPEDLAEKGIYLWRPLGITSLSNGNIVINDKKLSQILVFDAKGNFIQKIGRKGQGPAEFGNPYTLSATSRYIVVGDNSNMRINFFDYQGNFVNSFKTFKAYMDIAASERGLIFAAPMRVNPESCLVDVFDENGQLLRSFGKARFGDKDSNWQIPNFINICITDRGELFIAYDSFPLVCKYSKEGKLLAEYAIGNEAMKEKERRNLNRLNKGISQGLMTVIRSVYASKDGFYVLSVFPRAEILEYDDNGKLHGHFYYEYEYRSEDVLFYDFLVNENDGKKTFYLLKTMPENKIVLLRPKGISTN